MKNLTPEIIEKAKAAGSAEELLEIAKANNIEMTADEAKTYFAQLSPKSGEISDDDLDNVAGGACERVDESPLLGKIVQVTSSHTCKKCGGKIGRIATTPCGYGLTLCIECKDCSVGNRQYVFDFLDNCTYEIIG